jgi:hypothetical protein
MIHLLIIWMTIGAMHMLGNWTYGYMRNPEVMEKLIRFSFSTPKLAAATLTMGVFCWPLGVYLLLSGSQFAEKTNDFIATSIRREIIDGPKWKAALADQPRRDVLTENNIHAFSWGPAPTGATCGNPSLAGLKKMWDRSPDGGETINFDFTDIELCGKPAVVATTTIFELAGEEHEFEMEYCEECRPGETRSCPTCDGMMQGPPRTKPFCPKCSA